MPALARAGSNAPCLAVSSCAATVLFNVLAVASLILGRTPGLGTSLQTKLGPSMKPRPSIPPLPTSPHLVGAAQNGSTSTGMPINVIDQCRRTYIAKLKAIQSLPGADVVIGANDGVSFDPATRWGYWKGVPHHSKFFVEPSPPVFASLQQNFAGMPNAVLLNRAMRGAGHAPQLVLHCWNMPMLKALTANFTQKAKPFPFEHGRGNPAPFWNACCSTDRERLYYQAGAEGGGGSAATKRLRREVDRYILQSGIDTLTPGELIEQAGPARVVYVQIDVEGMDQEIVRALPFGRDGFRPKLVLYEESSMSLDPFLSSHGYSVCCCLIANGRNIVAVLE